MKVEVWSDFVCPFCYIGKRRFEEALSQFEHKDSVVVVFRSFELDPHSPVEPPHDVHGMLAAKYGMSREEAKAMNDQVTGQAETVGLSYRLDSAIVTNTFDAHRLAHYAEALGKGEEVVEALFKAYFTDSRHIGNPETLAELAAEAGIDRRETASVLSSGRFSEEVRSDEKEAGKLGVRGVPFFVFDRKVAVSGAQPVEMFLKALWQVGDESNR